MEGFTFECKLPKDLSKCFVTEESGTTVTMMPTKQRKR